MNISENSWIADGAKVMGDVSLADNVGVWFNAVIRGDCGPISIGENSNIQDNCTVHTDLGYEVIIGKNVTVGHNAIVHGCTVGDNTLIGMGAIILNGAKIGSNCIVGAGALVPENSVIPDGSVCVGLPAKVVRQTNESDREHIGGNAMHYVELMQKEKGE